MVFPVNRTIRPVLSPSELDQQLNDKLNENSSTQQKKPHNFIESTKFSDNQMPFAFKEDENDPAAVARRSAMRSILSRFSFASRKTSSQQKSDKVSQSRITEQKSLNDPDLIADLFDMYIGDDEASDKDFKRKLDELEKDILNASNGAENSVLDNFFKKSNLNILQNYIAFQKLKDALSKKNAKKEFQADLQNYIERYISENSGALYSLSSFTSLRNNKKFQNPLNQKILNLFTTIDNPGKTENKIKLEDTINFVYDYYSIDSSSTKQSNLFTAIMRVRAKIYLDLRSSDDNLTDVINSEDKARLHQFVQEENNLILVASLEKEIRPMIRSRL